MIIAAALFRVSTTKQVKKTSNMKDSDTKQKKDEEDSIPMQQHTVRTWAIQNEIELPPELELVEPGVSAYKISSKDRDILQDVLEAARQGKFTMLLLFKHTGRGGRLLNTR